MRRNARRREDVFNSFCAGMRVKEPKKVAKKGETSAMLTPAGEGFPRDVSVIILTLNEEVNIQRALESVSGSSDIVVLDCGSEDTTLQIAESHGARTLYRPFRTSAEQRQWALDNAGFRNEWVFVLDADEWVPTALADELRVIIAGQEAASIAGAWLRLRYVYEGRWIPRASLYPSWQMRLLRLGRVRYEPRSVNAHPVADGRTVRLNSDLVHEDLKSLTFRMRKLERQARLEALEISRWKAEPWASLKGAPDRRRRLKILASLLPLTAMGHAVFRLARGGFLEGRPGWLMAEDIYLMERMVSRYTREVRRQG